MIGASELIADVNGLLSDERSSCMPIESENTMVMMMMVMVMVMVKRLVFLTKPNTDSRHESGWIDRLLKDLMFGWSLHSDYFA